MVAKNTWEGQDRCLFLACASLSIHLSPVCCIQVNTVQQIELAQQAEEKPQLCLRLCFMWPKGLGRNVS